MPIDERYRALPFDEAVQFLQSKINLDTDSWRDLTGDEHDAAFIVAGAKGALLSDLRNAVENAIANGQTLDEFKAQFNRITEGWAHRGGKDWRAAIVYGTNLRMAHAAGRYQYQLDPEVVKLQPYLQWIHSGSREPRPLHLALDRQVFRANELPIYPPEGYGCRCRTIALTERQLQQRGLTVSNLKRGDTVEVEIDGKTYRPVIVPSEGWSGEAPGRGGAARREEILEKIIARSPEPIARQIRAEAERINQRFAQQELSFPIRLDG